MSETKKTFDLEMNEIQNDPHYSIGKTIIDALIILTGLMSIIYVFVMNDIILLKYLFTFTVVIFGVGYAIMKDESQNASNEELATGIMKLYLLDEEGEITNEWSIEGETSLLIGKKTSEGEVDIDLSTTEYESLINNEHAMLNYVSGAWYIEDYDSLNGIGIKRADKRMKSKLKHESPYRINTGDILYIANTRILVK